MAIVESIIESLAVKHIQNVGFTALGKDFTQENRLTPNPHQLLSKQIPAEEWQTLTPAQAISLGRVKKHIVKMIPDPTTGTSGNEKAFYADKSQDIQNTGETGFLYGFLSVPGSADWTIVLYEDNGNGTGPDYSKSITLGKGNSWAIDASTGILWLESGTTLNAFRKPFWLVGYTYVGKTLDIYEYQEQSFDNLLINSSFEHWFQNSNCPDGWDKGPGNLNLDTNDSLFGNSCLMINQVPGQQYWIRQYPSGFEPSPPAEGYQKLGKGWEGRDLCFSIYAKATTTVKTLKLRIEDGVGTTENSFTITDKWKRYKIIHRINSGADRIRVYIAPEAIGSAATTTVKLYVDGAMLTVGSALIPWIPRTINDTYDNRLFGNLKISSDLIVDEEVAVKKANPETDLDVNGRGRFQVSGIIPVSGSGTEIYYDQVNLYGRLFSYDRTLNQYRSLLLGDESKKQLFLTQDGNRIGILNDNPQSTLDIKGDLRLSANNNAEKIRFALDNLYIENEGNNNELIHIRPGGSSQGNLHSAISLYMSATNLSYSEKIRLHTNGDSYFLGGKIGFGTNQPQSVVDIRGALTLENSADAIIYTGIGTSELNRYLQLLNSSGNGTVSGLKAGGILVSDTYSYANPSKNDLIVKGKVGIGINNMSSYWDQANNLVIGNISGHSGLTIRAKSDSESIIAFADDESGIARYVGRIVYKHSNNSLVFNTNNPTGDNALILDANGNATIKGVINGASLNVGNGVITCGVLSSSISVSTGEVLTGHLQAASAMIDSIYGNNGINIDIDHDNNNTDRALTISHDNGVELLKLNESGLLTLKGSIATLEADGRVQAVGGILAGSFNDSLQTELITVYNGNFAITRPDSNIVNGTNLGSYRWYADDNSTGEGLELAAEIGYYSTGTWDSTNAPAKLSLRVKPNADSNPEEGFYVDYLKDGWIGRDFRVVRNLQVDGTIRTESSISAASADLRGGSLSCGAINATTLNITSTVTTPYLVSPYIYHDGDVRIDIDHNNNETTRKFFITANNVATDLFSVNESGNGYFSGALQVVSSISGASLSVGNGTVAGGAATFSSLTVNGVVTINGVINGQATAGTGDVLKVGNNAIISDIDISDMIGIKGVQNAANGGIVFGSAKDTNIYRSAANQLRTNDSFMVDGNFAFDTGASVNEILTSIRVAGTATNDKLVTEAAIRSLYDSHANRTNNPHAVTKAQVGLGNVPNWSSTDFDNRYLNQSNNLSDLTNTDTALVNLGCTSLLKRFNNNWTYGSISLSGSNNTYAGIYFNDVSRCFMVNAQRQGIYTTGSSWQWLWNNGTLEVGIVPTARLSGTISTSSLTGNLFRLCVSDSDKTPQDEYWDIPIGETFTLYGGPLINLQQAGPGVVIGVDSAGIREISKSSAAEICLEKDKSGQLKGENLELNLWNSSNYWGQGAKLSFGDANYVYIQEYEDDKLKIFANNEILMESPILRMKTGKIYIEGGLTRDNYIDIEEYRTRFYSAYVPAGSGGGFNFYIGTDLIVEMGGLGLTANNLISNGSLKVTEDAVINGVNGINSKYGYKWNGQSLDVRYYKVNSDIRIDTNDPQIALVDTSGHYHGWGGAIYFGDEGASYIKNNARYEMTIYADNTINLHATNIVVGKSGGNNGIGIQTTKGFNNVAGVYSVSSTMYGVFAQGVIGVFANGSTYAFYSSGGGYGSFTGSHDSIVKDDFSKYLKGMIVKVVDNLYKDNDDVSTTLPAVELAKNINDPSVLGVFSNKVNLMNIEIYKDLINESDIGVIINALGDGLVIVTDSNGDINIGDYITTSERPGFGQKQSDNVLRNYTVAKSLENVNWDDVEIDSDFGFKWKRIACTYHCG